MNIQYKITQTSDNVLQDWDYGPATSQPVTITYPYPNVTIGRIIFRNDCWVWVPDSYYPYSTYFEVKDAKVIKIVEKLLEQGIIKKDLESYRKALEIISERI